MLTLDINFPDFDAKKLNFQNEILWEKHFSAYENLAQGIAHWTALQRGAIYMSGKSFPKDRLKESQ